MTRKSESYTSQEIARAKQLLAEASAAGTRPIDPGLIAVRSRGGVTSVGRALGYEDFLELARKDLRSCDDDD